ncbi:MAG: hypothetical protein A2928_00955 [Candidatus Taylorbacteria bacterium RIFCSPLOWO2_01_FULL_45_15b]|uniref:Uncharacterized protein n=1 Tax=Candidatus Taylorbacteria bacterium RIFCSPLOWO2_01_FULL_45_15b TaxID=1802319 RepID=A0A1G2N7V5_9BACT|nr:MAG: hypothetical protein A2928_00955 [Candidatus Taylorbacteria bacterium RIFCSPLOWO2_01_FULL_45_15b]
MNLSNSAHRQIRKELNLEGFTEAECLEIIKAVEDNILEHAYLSILRNLTEKDREELGLLNDVDYHEKITSYLKLRLPNLESILDASVKEVVAEFNALRKK